MTKAELIRRVLGAAVERNGRPRPSAFGVFDGPEDLSERVDAHLAEGFGQE